MAATASNKVPKTQLLSRRVKLRWKHFKPHLWNMLKRLNGLMKWGTKLTSKTAQIVKYHKAEKTDLISGTFLAKIVDESVFQKVFKKVNFLSAWQTFKGGGPWNNQCKNYGNCSIILKCKCRFYNGDFLQNSQLLHRRMAHCHAFAACKTLTAYISREIRKRLCASVYWHSVQITQRGQLWRHDESVAKKIQ